MTIKDMFDNALSFCCEKFNLINKSQILELLYQGDNWTHSTFRYGLAKQVASYLNEIANNSIKAVYVYGTILEDRASFTSDIDMIVHSNNKSPEFQQAIKNLDKEILEYYKDLMKGKCEAMGHILDIHIVDDKEIEQKKGYGAVITSLINTPIRIWIQKEA
ncbi:MAG: nucleotidyltransferase domain-containing protein [Candidatus Aminicenantia bacterium]